MRLSDIRGEDALDLLAEIIEPITQIASDTEVAEVYRTKGSKIVDIVKVILRNHKKAVLKILALLDGEDPKTYAPSVLEIPAKLISLFNDPAFADFFPSQGQSPEETSSGSAMVNTGAIEKE